MKYALLLIVMGTLPLGADEIVFRDDFRNGLADGWSWVREDPQAWRTTAEGLELRVLPGNMWGPPNDARNVLVRPIPETGEARVELTVQVRNKPSAQYEQVDLVWYYDDSHMVKLGLEQVDGKLCVVMGREEKDRTRTVALIPKGTPRIGLRLIVSGDRIEGFYRPDGGDAWVKAGQTSLPVRGKPKASLQAYQGPADAEHWAAISGFRIRKLER